TWLLMKNLFIDEQVRIAADFLLKSFQHGENYNLIRQDIHTLMICQNQGSLNSIICVQEETKK
ncbi:MAG: hypothetical protein AB1589_38310, partial [Cyanobacteriota bacterium]